MTKQTEALELARDALRNLPGFWAGVEVAIDACDEALAQPEQEPFEDLAPELFVVAQTSPADDGFSDTIDRIESWLQEHFSTTPQRKWIGLTPEEILDLFDTNNVYGSKWIEFARSVETKLKEKNT